MDFISRLRFTHRMDGNSSISALSLLSEETAANVFSEVADFIQDGSMCRQGCDSLDETSVPAPADSQTDQLWSWCVNCRCH